MCFLCINVHCAAVALYIVLLYDLFCGMRHVLSVVHQVMGFLLQLRAAVCGTDCCGDTHQASLTIACCLYCHPVADVLSKPGRLVPHHRRHHGMRKPTSTLFGAHKQVAASVEELAGAGSGPPSSTRVRILSAQKQDTLQVDCVGLS